LFHKLAEKDSITAVANYPTMQDKDTETFYELSSERFHDWLAAAGQPSYRAQQVFEWAYQHAAASFDEMTNLPKQLRATLAEHFTIGPLESTYIAHSSETEKHLVRLRDGSQVECVSIQMKGAPTFCLSTQVGCAVACVVCASGVDGFDRNLSAGEIIQQAITLQTATESPGNIVFMGVGEPLFNFRNVLTAIERFTDKQAFGLSPSRITISTAGIVPAIHKLADMQLGVELAVSLGGATDEQRKRLMPGVARWSLEALLEACKHFTKANRGQPVTFAYVVVGGVNDDFDDARRLGKLLRPLRHHLNLIPLNPTAHCDMRPPSRDRLHAFFQECRKHGLNVSVRRSKGDDINAACGQLRKQNAQDR